MASSIFECPCIVIGKEKVNGVRMSMPTNSVHQL